jgi:filamentous hemagglutinin family protein
MGTFQTRGDSTNVHADVRRSAQAVGAWALVRWAGMASAGRVGRVGVAASVAAALSLGVAPVFGQPSGGTVINGSATINQSGSTTTINASNGTIINWQSFNVPGGTTTQFIQPNSTSTVLNRVTSADPTFIYGTLTANGRVFIVNPSGVIFGAGSVVNVGQLYAAAGHMSNDDFLRGNLRFTGLTGQVINEGSIRAQQVALIGRSVVNSGSIVAPGGAVMMLAGDDVYVGERDGSVFARVSMSERVDASQLGVSNTGTIDASGGQVLMAASDMFGHAIFNSGTIRARAITIESQRALGAGPSLVTVGGTLDASQGGGSGGSVTITGDRIFLDDARIVASGDTGGGSVRIGGDYQGSGDLRTASRVLVSNGTTIEADARMSGNGGRVIVWSDQATAFNGTISARGGQQSGNGGFAEVSSKGTLSYRGFADLRAPNGSRGTLLLDPKNIIIQTGGGDPLTGNILFGDNPSATVTFDPSIIVNALNGANLILQANNDITIASLIDATANAQPGALTLRAGRDILVNASIRLNGAFTAIANDNNANISAGDRDAGPGRFIMAPGTTISTNNNAVQIAVRAGIGNVGNGGDITLSTIDAGTSSVLVQNVSTTANAGIRMDPAGIIIADSVALVTIGPVGATIGTLANPIQLRVNTLAMVIEDGGVGYIASPTTGLSIGSFSQGVFNFSGITLAGGAVSASAYLNITGPTQINSIVSLNTGEFRLASLGSVTQAVGAGLQVANVGIINTLATGGNIDLLATNNQIEVLAVRNDAAGGRVRVVSDTAIVAGTVTGNPTWFNAGAALSGITTTNNATGPFTNDITLSAGGLIQLTGGPLNAGSGAVRLRAGNGISQTGAGLITAASVGAINSGAGDIVLDLANTFANLTAVNRAAGGKITARSTSSLTIAQLDTITGLWADPSATSAASVAGIILVDNTPTPLTNNLLLISDTGSLAINSAINAGGGVVRLLAQTGVSQNTSGTISSGQLAVINTTSGQIALTSANAVTGAVAIANRSTAAGDGVVFFGGATTIGTIVNTGTGFNNNNDLVGVTTASNQDALLNTTGLLTINSAVNVGTGTLRVRTIGGVQQGDNGIVTASILGAINSGSGNLNFRAINQIATSISMVNRASNGTLTLRNAGSITIASLATIANQWFDPTNASGTNIDGVITTSAAGTGVAGSNITLRSNTGSLTINKALDAGRGILRIQTATGVTQGADGIVSANTLGIVNTTSGDIFLDRANAISGTFAAWNQAAGAEVFLNNRATSINNGTLTLGTVAGVADLFIGQPVGTTPNTAVNGIVTNKGNVTLFQPGAITINNGINAGPVADGGIIRLSVWSGVNQGSDEAAAIFGRVLAGVNRNGAAPGANGAEPATTGRLAFFNNSNNVGTIAGWNYNNGADVSIFNTGNLTIGALTGNTGRYADFNGGADLRGIRNGGRVVNGVAQVGNGNSGSQVRVRQGSLTISENVNFGLGGGYFQGATGVTQTGSSVISIATLVVRNEVQNLTFNNVTETGTTSGNILLMGLNEVGSATVAGKFAAANLATGGSVRFNNTRSIEFTSQTNDGLVQATGVSTTNNTAGANTNDILIKTTGLLTINENLNAGGGVIRLQSGTGITQNDDTSITAAALAAVNTTSGDIFLDGANSSTGVGANNVPIVALWNKAAGRAVAFANGSFDLRAGAVAIDADFNDGAAVEVGGRNLITTDGGRVLLASGTSITLTQSILTNGGDVVLLGPVILGQAGDNTINTRFTGGYTYAGGGRVIIQGDVTVPTGNDNTRSLVITTPIGPEITGISPAVIFGGNIGTQTLRLLNLSINADDARTAGPNASTVIFGARAQGISLVPVNAYSGQLWLSNLNIGNLERTAVLGNLTVNGTGANATSIRMGDLLVTGTATFFSDAFTFFRRGPGPNLGRGSDTGLSIAVNNPLIFNGAQPTFAGPGGAGSIASPAGDLPLGGLSRVALADAFTAGSLISAGGGVAVAFPEAFQRLELATAFPGALPPVEGATPASVGGTSVTSVEGVDALGVRVRTASVDESNALSGGGLLVDMPSVERPLPGDFSVASSRLNPTQVRRLGELYGALFGAAAEDRADELSSALASAWREFRAERRVDAGRAPLAFRQWLQDRAGEGRDTLALAALDGARELFVALEQTGMTRAETRGPRINVLRQLAGSWLPGEQYDALQTAVMGASPLAMR